MTKLDSTGTTVVDPNNHWRPMTTAPLGVKLQLLSAGEVAVYGTYNGKDKFWRGWAPLPTRRRQDAPANQT